MHVGTFAGRVGRDAEIKALSTGKELMEFSLAVDKYKAGEKQTLWVKAVVWGDRARKLEPYVKKGTSVTVTGRVDVNAYTSKAGELKAEILCDVSELTLQGSKRDDAGERPAAPPPATSPAPPPGDFNDDIPF